MDLGVRERGEFVKRSNEEEGKTSSLIMVIMYIKG